RTAVALLLLGLAAAVKPVPGRPHRIDPGQGGRTTAVIPEHHGNSSGFASDGAFSILKMSPMLRKRVFAIVLAASVVGSSAVHAAMLPLLAGNSPATVEQEGATYDNNHALCAAGFRCPFCTMTCSHGVAIVADATALSEGAASAPGARPAAPSRHLQPERINPIRAPPQRAS
ncbi:MAG: hypothetical protein ACE5FM_09420, partial [Methyloligellaceae bacterium]